MCNFLKCIICEMVKHIDIFPCFYDKKSDKLCHANVCFDCITEKTCKLIDYDFKKKDNDVVIEYDFNKKTQKNNFQDVYIYI